MNQIESRLYRRVLEGECISKRIGILWLSIHIFVIEEKAGDRHSFVCLQVRRVELQEGSNCVRSVEHGQATSAVACQHRLLRIGQTQGQKRLQRREQDSTATDMKRPRLAVRQGDEHGLLAVPGEAEAVAVADLHPMPGEEVRVGRGIRAERPA